MGEVHCQNPLTEPGWDRWISQFPGHTFFHEAAWAAGVTRAYRFPPCYLVVPGPVTEGGVLPLVEVRSRLTGCRGVGLPFTDFAAPLAADAAVFGRLHDRAVQLGRERGWKYLEYRGGRDFLGTAPAAVQFHGHRLDLRPGIDRLFAALDPATRRAVRKAEKSGLTVVRSERGENLADFYQLMCRTRRKHGLPPAPLAFFESLRSAVMGTGGGVLVTAQAAGRAVAAAWFCHSGPRAIYKYGASDERFQHLRGANLVMWEGIKWYADRGVEELHFGRTELGNEGLRRFKLGWGSSEEIIEYFRFDLKTARFVLSNSGVAGWQHWAFSRMPFWMARLAGQFLYRHSA